MLPKQDDQGLRQVVVTPDLLELARKLQSGVVRKVEITENMVGNSLYANNQISIVRPPASRR